MMTRRRWLLMAVAVGLRSEETYAADALVVVPVVAAGSPLRDVSLALLERIFLGGSVDDTHGRKLVPFNHPPKTAVRTLFDRRVLDMSPEEVARYWVDQRIRGNVRPPRTVPRTDLLRKVVAQLPGAISYLAVDDLDTSVRALTVGGTAYDSPKYPIR